MVFAIMNQEETFRNHPHQHQHPHHSYGGPTAPSAAVVNSINNGTSPYSSYNNSMLMMRKEWQSGGRISHSGVPMDSVTLHAAPSVTMTESTCHSVGSTNQTKPASPSQSHESNGSSHGGSGVNNSNSSYKIREIMETLLYCYLECGGSVRSEEFKKVVPNLVEVFLGPIFEPLRVLNNRSSGSSHSNGASCNSLPSSASSFSATTCVATCSASTSSSVSAFSGMSSSVPFPSSSFSNDNVDCGDRNNVCRLLQGDVLSCPTCYGILIEPVTIPCGHTYCKKCLQKETVGRYCRQCAHILTSGDVSQCKTNVLLGSLVEKWWPKEVSATNLRNEGNSLFQRKKVEEALVKYSQALNLAPDDHLSLGNRSHALLTAGKSEEALQDAEAATRCCPAWPKGYFRKSAALISLGRYEEAFLSLTLCMYLIKVASCTLVPPPPPTLPASQEATATPSSPSMSSTNIKECTKEDPVRTQVINEMIKILQKIFLQTTHAAVGSILKRHNIGEQVQFTPYPNGRKPCVGRHLHERRRPGYGRNADWNNDSENTSSGDESDNQLYSCCPSSNTTDSNKAWCYNQRVHYPVYAGQCGHYNKHNNHSHSGQHKSHMNSSPTPLVEQLSNRMNRLLCRATQDLKSFENRLKSQQHQTSTTVRQVDPSLISCNDVECSLCYRLLFQPVSTGCGHTFCRSCLERCLDHNPSCPLCKTSLQSYLASREHAINEFLEVAIRHFLPKEREERLSQHLEELNSTAVPIEGKTSLDVDVPIFVCTMAFPTIPCPLHVFEPRYRLMIRRCMENGSNRFGMCCYLAEGEHNYGEIGTLLEIKNIQYFADGRSVVDTVGCRRFRVVRKTMVDGYNTARIEFLNDRPVENEEIPVITALHDKVFSEATEWLQSIGQVRRQRILSHFGPMPAPEENWLGSPDGPSWTWWLLAILPLDSKAQLSILSMCSLQKRLDCILKVLSFVKNRMSSISE